VLTLSDAFVDAAGSRAYRPTLRIERESAACIGGARQQQRVLGMARRRAGKATNKSASARTRTQQPKPKSGAAGPTLVQRLTALERERDALRGELERSRARVRQLEDCQAQVRDRIAWALDSLHNILDGKG
jgi:hypothetical protein